jgi:2-polyprenyl-6-hydroxyphenyl methylase/3-demethylubiquinone-9 3-methyltransferase
LSQVDRVYGEYWSDAESADPENDPTTPARLSLLREALARIRSGSKVLDAGCGGGLFVREMSAWGYDVTGIDLSEAALGLAARRAPSAKLIRADLGQTLPLEHESFDAVFSTEVVEHLLDAKTFFSELSRVLKPGGLLALTTPYHGLVKNVLIAILGFDRHFDPTGSHIRFFTNRSLAHLLQESGFAVRRTKGVGRLWPLYKSLWVEAVKRG